MTRTTVLDFYAQDTWKVNPHLVLDYGMRTSYSLAQKLVVGNNFVPSTYNPLQAPVLYQPNSTGTAIDPTTGISTYPKAYVGLLVPNTGNLTTASYTPTQRAGLRAQPITRAYFGSHVLGSHTPSTIRRLSEAITASSITRVPAPGRKAI
jgi:hypothetical protein